MPRFLGPTSGLPGSFDYELPDGTVVPIAMDPAQAELMAQQAAPEPSLRPPEAPMAPTPPPGSPLMPQGNPAQSPVPQPQVPEPAKVGPQLGNAARVGPHLDPGAGGAGLTAMFRQNVDDYRARQARLQGVGSMLGQFGNSLGAPGTPDLLQLLAQSRGGR